MLKVKRLRGKNETEVSLMIKWPMKIRRAVIANHVTCGNIQITCLRFRLA